MKKREAPIGQLLAVMARLRAPDGCPWDREQTHQTLRFHAVEEVYELMDAIEANDDVEMAEELGDLLLQVVFHCQLAQERGAFDFDQVARGEAEKLIRRHPHVFGNAQAKTVDAVWAQWEKIKKEEKAGTAHQRASALDGIPKHLPALMKAEKLMKKARKAGLLPPPEKKKKARVSSAELGRELFRLASEVQARGESPEALLLAEIRKREKALRAQERKSKASTSA